MVEISVPVSAAVRMPVAQPSSFTMERSLPLVVTMRQASAAVKNTFLAR